MSMMLHRHLKKGEGVAYEVAPKPVEVKAEVEETEKPKKETPKKVSK